MIVVDASVLVEILMGGERVQPLSERVLGSRESLHAPHLIDTEVMHALRAGARRGRLTPYRGRLAVAALHDFPLERHGHQPLLERIWQLRDNATAYDATYLALAEALGAVFVTCDSALGSVPGVRAEVEVF